MTSTAVQHPRFTRRAAIVGGVALTAGLAACSKGGSHPGSDSSGWSIPSTDPTATIKVLSILDLKADHMQPVVDAFEKAHPTIKVDWQTVPFDSLNSTIDARVTNKGGDPDVYWADQPRISALAARGEAEDLTDAFSGAKDDFDATAYNAGLYKDRLWALPIANSTQLLYYNKDLLAKAHLTASSPDVAHRLTWEQLAADAA